MNVCGVCNFPSYCKVTDGKTTLKVCVTHLLEHEAKGWKRV